MPPESSKQVVRITVVALERGRLSLVWEYSDGTGEACQVTVAAIHKVLADHGHHISAENLSRIAFCGGRMIVTRKVAGNSVVTPVPIRRN